MKRSKNLLFKGRKNRESKIASFTWWLDFVKVVKSTIVPDPSTTSPDQTLLKRLLHCQRDSEPTTLPPPEPSSTLLLTGHKRKVRYGGFPPLPGVKSRSDTRVGGGLGKRGEGKVDVKRGSRGIILHRRDVTVSE